jgi:hypothetical protein
MMLLIASTVLFAGCVRKKPDAWRDQRINQSGEERPTETPAVATPTPTDEQWSESMEEDLRSLDEELSSLDDELRSLGVDTEEEGW